MRNVKKALSCIITAVFVMSSFVVPANAEDNVLFGGTFRNGEIPEGFKTTGDYETVEVDSEGYTMVRRKSVGGRAGTYVGIENITLDGNIEIEARMKLNEHALNYDFEGYNYGPGFMPMTFYADGSGVGGGKNYLMFYSNLLNIKDNGKLYAFNASKSASRPFDSMGIKDATELDVTIEADKWYTFKYILNVDGDSTTTDTWYYAVYDENGNELVSNMDDEPYYIIYSVDGNCNYNKMESINSLYFGLHKRTGMATENGESVMKSGIVTYDYVKVGKAKAPELFVDLQNENVPATITEINFSYDMELSDILLLSGTELYCGKTKVENINISFNDDNKSGKIEIPDGLINNRKYKLVFPSVVGVNKMSSNITEFEFTTSAKKSNVIADRESAILEGTIAPGEEITVSVPFVNSSDKSEKSCLIVCVLEGEYIKNIAFCEQEIAAQSTEDLSVKLNIPEDISDAKVIAYAWDSFAGMNASMDVLEW